MAAVCAGLTNAGQPCTAFAVSDSVYCFAHAPERKAERLAARIAGGRARQPLSVAAKPDTMRLRSVEDVQRLLEAVALDAMQMSNGQARNRLLVAVAQVALTAIERADDVTAIRDAVERLRAESRFGIEHPALHVAR
jgi:hypothetical protein